MSSTWIIKYLVALAYLVAVCYGASLRAAFPLTNQQVLDTQGNFILRWGFKENTGDIEFEMQANCTGWLGIGISSPDGASVDIVMGGYDDVNEVGYLQDRYVNVSDPVNGGTFDESIDLVLKGAVYHEPWTIVRFARSLFTGDLKDVTIVPGPMVVGWAYAQTDDTDADHDLDSRGVAFVTFITPSL